MSMSYADRKNKKLYERDFTMNKSQLVDVVAKNTGLKKKDAEAAVSAFVDAVAEALVAGEKVQISGLGTFEVKTKASRTIPASKRPAFTAGKTLKESLNK